MTKIFGDFIEDFINSQEYLEIVFSPGSVPLKQRWRTNGLSADFMADYFAVFFAKSETKAEVKSSVSFIANELLENAMKFNDETSDHSIRLTLQLHEDTLVFLSTNSINPQEVGKFQAFIQELVTCDPGELYISQLEKNAEDETHTGSRLGLLTMINDYLVKIGWKFNTIQKNPEVITVSTMVHLTL
ncbi:MAG: ATP-binding protein [Stigonema ocellatum SAG 48.90 = DSM 106950]|nr:ATP-binding protein [Stigonema ocellatum SAG 48.90 = DSM 106950]